MKAVLMIITIETGAVLLPEKKSMEKYQAKNSKEPILFQGLLAEKQLLHSNIRDQRIQHCSSIG
jgi:hypothetical protein